jgi:hypothetical protein
MTMIREAGDDGQHPEPAPPPTDPEAVFGSLKHAGPPLTLGEMDAAVMAEARRRSGERPESLHLQGRGSKVPAGGDETAGK